MRRLQSLAAIGLRLFYGGVLSAFLSCATNSDLALREELNAGWASALCKEEVQQFLADIRSACQPGHLCANSRIQSVAVDIEAQHHGRFLTLMASQRHAAIFFGQRPHLVESHRIHIQRIVEKPWLPTTRFLVMSNTGSTAGFTPGAVERAERTATERGELVINEILKIHPEMATSLPQSPEVQPRHRTNERVIHVVFNFEPKRDEILAPADRPPPGSNFKQSVWIFRVDC